MTISLEQQFNNLLSPFGSFSSWSNGPNSAPDGWEVLGVGATIAQDTTNVKYSPFSASLTRGTADCRLRRLAGGINYYRGRTFSFGAWVRATVANRVRIAISDNTGDSYSAYHSGSSNWEFLTVIRELGARVTNFNVSLVIENGSTTAQINGAILVEGNFVHAFVRGNGEIIFPVVLRNPDSAPNDVEWVWKYLNNTYTQGEPCFVLMSNQQGLGNDLRVVITRYGHMALWPVEGSEATPIPKSPFSPTKINALSIDGDIVFGDHLVHHNTPALSLRRLPLALPHGILNITLNAGATSVTVTTGGRLVGLPAPGHATYRAAIWDTTQGYGTDGNPDAAEIIKVTNTVDNGDGTYTLTIIRGQDNTSDVQHTVGTGKTPRITKLLDSSPPPGDFAVTNILSGEERASGRILGGAGIGMYPLGGSSEEDGYITIDAYGRGNTGNANCIIFRTTKDKNMANPSVTERARITSDGSIEHFVDSTKDSIFHKKVARLNNISAWTTIATITPFPIANHYTRGHVEARIGGHNNGANTGLLISKWYVNVNAGTITVGNIPTDITDGAAPPQFRLNVSGGDIQVQVNKHATLGSDFTGTAFIEAFLPRAYGTGLEWSVK
ncbi:MAG TPA: hypothetical protein ACFYEA_09480 [Candidatus Tripitaka californicus]|uniref:hypothetical protein n=1 Tax=Candidatus Tripitaka californicus TaxID=3367616 RepID=UPI004026284B